MEVSQQSGPTIYIAIMSVVSLTVVDIFTRQRSFQAGAQFRIGLIGVIRMSRGFLKEKTAGFKIGEIMFSDIRQGDSGAAFGSPGRRFT